MREYKKGDVITIRVSVADIDEFGGYVCTHVGYEGYYATQDTDSMVFDESDIVES